MKKLALLIVFQMGVFALYAQIEYSQLEAPTSPAASIIGAQPKTILSPKSYQALETALYNNFTQEGQFAIPSDLSLEFTPYWAKDRGITLDEYLYPEKGAQFWRSLSFSIASSDMFQLEDSSNSTVLAYGIRSTLYFPNREDRETIKGYQEKISSEKKITATIEAKLQYLLVDSITIEKKIRNKEHFIDSLRSLIYPDLPYVEIDVLNKFLTRLEQNLPELESSNHEAFLIVYESIINEEFSQQEVYLKYKDYITKRYGLSLDLAYAGFVGFPKNRLDFSYVPKNSLWVTGVYRNPKISKKVALTGVLRYEWYNLDFYKNFFPNREIFENNVDYGLGVNLEWERFSVNFEAVGRISSTEIPAGFDEEGNELYRKAEDSDFQFIASFNYNVSGNIVLSYNLGEQFNSIALNNETLVSQFTLNFGFGSP